MAGESEGDRTDNDGERMNETTSPKNRVKFLCSHGGRILPRPTDGQLKYVGGETRAIAIPRDTSFSGFECDIYHDRLNQIYLHISWTKWMCAAIWYLEFIWK